MEGDSLLWKQSLQDGLSGTTVDDGTRESMSSVEGTVLRSVAAVLEEEDPEEDPISSVDLFRLGPVVSTKLNSAEDWGGIGREDNKDVGGLSTSVSSAQEGSRMHIRNTGVTDTDSQPFYQRFRSTDIFKNYESDGISPPESPLLLSNTSSRRSSLTSLDIIPEMQPVTSSASALRYRTEDSYIHHLNGKSGNDVEECHPVSVAPTIESADYHNSCARNITDSVRYYYDQNLIPNTRFDHRRMYDTIPIIRAASLMPVTRGTAFHYRRGPFQGNAEMYCKFCFKNGETWQFYTTHKLKDNRGMIICPILRKFVCPHCGATGDHAHTESHCTLKHSA